MLDHTTQLFELSGAPISDPVSRIHHEIRRKFAHPAERFNDVRIVDFGTDVQVAQLRKCASFKFARKSRDRQFATRQLKPVRLDPPRIKPTASAPPPAAANVFSIFRRVKRVSIV
jgi:hypothetical protein